MYGYGDIDGPGFPASGDELVGRAGNRLPFGATLRGSPAGAGGGLCSLCPPQRRRHMSGAGRDVWVKIRASEAERAEWHAKARSSGLTLSDLVRRSVGRVRPWTVAHAEAVEIVAHLVAIERPLAALAPVGSPDPDAH